jgi:ribosomal protein S18 acetylase RimI-like enzyme
MEISIRPYLATDLEACRWLWVELTQTHRDLYGDANIGGDDPGKAFDQYLTHPGLAGLWVAMADGQVVGMAGLLVNGDEADVEPVIIGSNFRGKGFGRCLIDQAVKEAQRRGLHYLSVKPVARNIPAIAFFVEMGFDKIGQIELFQELTTPVSREWREGISLHGHRLQY